MVAAATTQGAQTPKKTTLPSRLYEAIQQYIAWEPNSEFREDAKQLLEHSESVEFTAGKEGARAPQEQTGNGLAGGGSSNDKDGKATTITGRAASRLLVGGTADVTTLEKQFLTRLEFGTAGLRGRMGSGLGCMNVLTVMQAAQGLSAYLLDRFPSEKERRSRGFVIGFDARFHSKQFAHTVAAVFLSSGFCVRLFRNESPTPLVPYSVVKCRALGGAQLTASHNPKYDNGFKVYSDRGAQIVAPVDRLIVERIDANLAPWAGALELLDFSSGLLCREVLEGKAPRSSRCLSGSLLLMDTVGPGAHVPASYVEDVATLLKSQLGVLREPGTTAAEADPVWSPPKVVYTALHGVGYSLLQALLERCGFDTNSIHAVVEQRDPDPEFRTLAFPNPEEKGALDLAIALATSIGAPIVIANDPDADRFGSAELEIGESGGQQTRRWHIFKGDELGVLFGAYFLERLTKHCGADPKHLLFVNSAVSSEMIRAIAAASGSQYAQTLTGFKWMMNKCLDLVEASSTEAPVVPILVYEEALGYSLTPTLVPDKDGLAAAAAWMMMVSEIYGRGQTMLGTLRELQARFGVYVANNGYFICHDRAAFAEIFNGMRASGRYFNSVGRFPVARIVDPSTNYDSAALDRRCSLPQSNEGQMISIYFESGAKVTLRTSGTEPKLKWYSEFSGRDEAATAGFLEQVVNACITELLQPHKYPLQRPSQN